MTERALSAMVLGLFLSVSFPSAHAVAAAADGDGKKTSMLEFNKRSDIHQCRLDGMIR
jgi:hypothetical protein